ncbi:MAG TPA: methyltransferase domain-containing protein [Actinomycetota bacterium]|jgi:ubiquinone/menaquinone biosynthesis C-methylase UbiE|nr:methyltransferase domain-containing protein [Actinomycetota bacterium]
MTEHFTHTDYEHIAEHYDTHRAQWEIPRDDLVASLAADGPIIAIDIGCGTGLYLEKQAQELTGLPISLVGIDPSAAMLRGAASKHGPARYVNGIAEALPFSDRCADYVHSSYVYHHFSDKEAALDEMCRVLRGPGCIRIVDIEPWSMPNWWVYEFFPETVELDHSRFKQVDWLTTALERRGLVAEARVERATTMLKLDDALTESESRTISQHASIDDSAYRRGVERLRAFARDHTEIERQSAVLFLTARKT